MADLNLRDPEFLRALERLKLVSKRAVSGALKGERRSTRRGVSIEFADYRDYVPGDDLRYLDHNIYGRLDRLLIKLFVEEEDLRVYLLLDRSRSMAFGDPSKFDYARRLTAALAWLGLVGLDRVTVASFGSGLEGGLPPLRGAGNVGRVFDFLTALQPDGGTGLAASLTRFGHEHPQPGLCVVVSDFLDPAGYQAGLRALQARRYEVVALQVLAPDELNPQVTGDLKLIDSETGEAREITVSDSLLRRYRRSAAAWCDGLRQFCRGRGMAYVQALTSDPVEALVQTALRRLGLVR
ncbi:MAG: DUF58 domain-containing protein [Fimbriimonadaceae bacterium]|nr:DUF58 domain-containing protein [Fimbriimonadaceae bacterium]